MPKRKTEVTDVSLGGKNSVPVFTNARQSGRKTKLAVIRLRMTDWNALMSTLQALCDEAAKGETKPSLVRGSLTLY